jgi:fatty acyl-CoA reductase
MKNSPVFDRIRENHPERLQKIISIEGDTTKGNLGISNEDLELIYDKIDLVFHSAASIRMDESINDALKNNTLPAKKLIEMSKKIKIIKVSL